jgi:hypothetical protein
MSEQRQSTGLITVSREHLYQQVWTTPISRLAEGYGLSGNGLKKICRRLAVPVPPRGYWAKRAAGKKVKQTALPPPPDGSRSSVTITPASPSVESKTPEIDPALAEQLQIAMAKAQGVRVRPWRGIEAYSARLSRLRALRIQSNSSAIYFSASIDCEVSKRCIGRNISASFTLLRKNNCNARPHADSQRGWELHRNGPAPAIHWEAP